MKRRISFLPLICVFCLGISTNGAAQDSANTINKISISSPTAASLGKYGDYTANYNSGVPNISIPLYTLESKDLSMPISLSYHASGLKVHDAASWVGAGWSLNAGGVITRSVVGTPDDGALAGTSIFATGHYKDYGYNSYLWVHGTGYGSTSDQKRPDDGAFLNGYKDGEPDMFAFNINGTSGKFYFNDDRTAVLVPEQDLKIQADFSVGNGFTGFVVTSSEGTKYYFGKSGNNGSVDPIELTIPMTFEDGAAFQQKANSSWYLNKIVSVDGMDSILLKYATETYSYYTLSMFPVSYYQKSSLFGPGRHGYNLVKNLVNGVRLTEVVSLNGTVTFGTSALRTDLAAGWPTVIGHQPNTSAYSLGNIQINNNNGFCKKFEFKYGYFFDNTTALQGPILTNSAFSTIQTDKYKLRLDTLQGSVL